MIGPELASLALDEAVNGIVIGLLAGEMRRRR